MQNNSLPPSPHGSSRDLMRRPLDFFLTISRTYGDIVCYRPAPEPAYLVNHPDYIRHVLVDNYKNYSKETYINQMFKKVVADGLLVSEGETWRRQRRMMQPAFHQQRIAGLSELVVAETSKMLEKWSAQEDEPVDISREMSVLTLSIITKALFGVDIGSHAAAVGQAVNLGGDLLEKPRHPRFQKALETVEEVVQHIITERRKTGKDTGDLLSMLLDAQDEETGATMDDRQLRHQVVTLLLAGYETTANALTWTWYLLAQHPEVADKVREEVDRELKGCRPTYTDLVRLPYTLQVFQEGMRLYPSAWILGRKALHDDEIGGYPVAAGTIVAISPYTMHRHPGYWENPDDFDPDRFSPERSAGRHRFAYLPFGAGPRQCIGNRFALMEAHLIIAAVSQRYRMELLPGQDIHPQPIFILRPDREIWMKLQS